MPKLTQPAARPVEKQSAWASYDMEATVCPWCGPIPGVKIRFDFDPFKVVVCRKCSLTFLSPRLTEAHALQIYQGEDYFRSSVPGQG